MNLKEVIDLSKRRSDLEDELKAHLRTKSILENKIDLASKDIAEIENKLFNHYHRK